MLAVEPDWRIQFEEHAEDFSLNFTCSNPARFRSESSDGVLGPGGSVTLALKQISADPAGGVKR